MKKMRSIYMFLMVIAMFLYVFQPPVHSKSVSVDTAEEVAEKFLTPEVLVKVTEPVARIVSEVFTQTRDGIPVYYIVTFDPEGWVIISADDVARPIIAYSATGTVTLENIPPACENWMAGIEEDIYSAIAQGLEPLPETLEEWSELLTNTRSPAAKAISVEPLLKTKWGQGGLDQPFVWAIPWLKSEDTYCPWEKKRVPPYVGPFFYQVAPTGCVATAMGQIMKYWAWPVTGEGSKTWDPPYGACCTNTYGPYTVNFAEREYGWNIMPNHVLPKPSVLQSDGDKAVARLLRDIGVAVEMNYEPGGSGASDTDARDAFRNHFRYTGEIVYRTDSPDDIGWSILLMMELDSGRPVYYSGSASGANEGHAFVCDGHHYGGTFHFNWGWDGFWNGYFEINDITPGWPEKNYNDGNTIIRNIHPDTTPVARCKATTLYLDQNGQAVLATSDIDDGSDDPYGEPITLEVDKSLFDCSDVGTTTVTLTVTNSWGKTDTCTALVTVIDDTPPTAMAKDITVFLDASGQASITAADIDNGSSDNCGIASMEVLPKTFTCYDVGKKTVTLTVTDSHDNTADIKAEVTVEDNIPPEISVSVSPDTLWPPNHKMILITPTVIASDNCASDPSVELTSITANEEDGANAYGPNYDSTTADGYTENDIKIDENGNIYLRAERSGTGNGRIYTLTYTATDLSGNSTTASATVTVPHNQ